MSDIETISEVSQVADYVIASQRSIEYLACDEECWNGIKISYSHLDSFFLFTQLTLYQDQNTIETIAQYACSFNSINKFCISKQEAAFLKEWQKDNNFVVVSTELLGNFYKKFNTLSFEINNSNSFKKTITRINKIIKNKCKSVGKKTDIYDFIRLLKLIQSDDQFSKNIRNAAWETERSLKKVIIQKYGEKRSKHQKGISFFIPFSKKSENYKLLKGLYLAKNVPEWYKLCKSLASLK